MLTPFYSITQQNIINGVCSMEYLTKFYLVGSDELNKPLPTLLM